MGMSLFGHGNGVMDGLAVVELAVLELAGGEWLRRGAMSVLIGGTVLLVAASVATWLMGRWSAAARHRVWGLTLGMLVVLPWLSQLLPRWEVAVVPQAMMSREMWPVEAELPEEVTPIEIPRLHDDHEMSEAAVPERELVKEVAKQEMKEEAAVTKGWGLEGWTFRQIAEVVWVAGMGVSVLWAVWCGFLTARLWRSGSDVAESEQVWRLMEELRLELGIRRRVQLREHASMVVPMTWGILRPVILLPCAARGWSPELLRGVLLHELAHVRRWDVGYQLLGRLGCAVGWFHPLAWWGLHRLRVEREHACDDMVVHTGERASDYAEQLLAVATMYKSRQSALMGVGVGLTRGGSLEGRVRALFDGRRSHAPLGVRGGAVLSVGVLGLGVGLAVVRPVASSATAAMPTGVVQADVAKEEEKQTSQKGLHYTIKVVDARGKPVAGAKLVSLGLGLTSGTGMMWPKSWPKDFVTNAEGTVTIDVTDVSEVGKAEEKARIDLLYVGVQHAEHPYLYETASLDDDQKMQTLILEDGVRVRMRVRREGSKEVLTKDVYVSGSGYNRAKNFGLTAVGEAFQTDVLSQEKPEGQRFLRVVHAPAGEPAWFSDRIDAQTMTAKNGIAETEVTVHPGVRVAGKLAENVPRPVQEGTVSACLVDGATGEEGIWSDLVEVKEDGTFVFESLPRDRNLQMIGVCRGWVSTSSTKEEMEEYAKRYGTSWQYPASGVLPQLLRISDRALETVLTMEQTGSCEVTVLDAGGKPMAGATVRFNPNQRWWDHGSNYVGAGGSTVRGILSGSPYQDFGKQGEKVDRRYVGVTNAEGKCVIEWLPKGTQDAWISHEGWELPPLAKGEVKEFYQRYQRTIRPVKIAGGERAKLVVRMQRKTSEARAAVGGTDALKQGSAVTSTKGEENKGEVREIRVVDARGNAIKGGKLTLMHLHVEAGVKGYPMQNWKKFDIDQAGIARVDLTALGEDFGARVEQMKDLALILDHPDFPQQGKGVLLRESSLKYVAEDGVRVRIRAFREGTKEPLTSDVLVEGSGLMSKENIGKRMADGRVETAVLNLKDGQWGRYLWVIHAPADQPAWFSNQVDIASLPAKDGVAEIDVTLRRGVRVEGRLPDEVPRPITNGLVQVTLREGNGARANGWLDFRAIDAEGKFVFESLPPEKDGWMAVACDGWISKTMYEEDHARYEGEHGLKRDLLARSRARQERLFLSGEVVRPVPGVVRTGRCEVTVVDEKGQPLKGVGVRFHPGWGLMGLSSPTLEILKNPEAVQKNLEIVESARRRFTVTTDANGKGTLERLPPGEIFLQVTSEAYELDREATTKNRLSANLISWRDPTGAGSGEVRLKVPSGERTTLELRMRRKR